MCLENLGFTFLGNLAYQVRIPDSSDGEALEDGTGTQP